MGTRPVGLHDTTLRATSGGGGVKTSVAHEGEDRVFVRGVNALVLEDFGGTDTVGVAGLSLCGFHMFDGHKLPAQPTVSHGLAGEFRHRQNASDPNRGQG